MPDFPETPEDIASGMSDNPFSDVEDEASLASKLNRLWYTVGSKMRVSVKRSRIIFYNGDEKIAPSELGITDTWIGEVRGMDEIAVFATDGREMCYYTEDGWEEGSEANYGIP